MTIDEVMKRKARLENDVRSLIEAFGQDTGLTISRLDFEMNTVKRLEAEKPDVHCTSVSAEIRL
jgi:hypothetical protein